MKLTNPFPVLFTKAVTNKPDWVMIVVFTTAITFVGGILLAAALAHYHVI